MVEKLERRLFSYKWQSRIEKKNKKRVHRQIVTYGIPLRGEAALLIWQEDFEGTRLHH